MSKRSKRTPKPSSQSRQAQHNSAAVGQDVQNSKALRTSGLNVDLSHYTPLVDSRNFKAYAAYQFVGSQKKVLCFGDSFKSLIGKVGRRLADGEITNPHIVVYAADTHSNLLDPVREEVLERVVFSIRWFRNIGYKKGLARISSELRKKGTPRGRAVDPSKNQAVIEILRKMEGGRTSEQIASEVGPTLIPERAASERARISKFYDAVESCFRSYSILYGEPDLSGDCGTEFNEMFSRELGLNLPEDMPLIRRALRPREYSFKANKIQ